MKKNKILVVGLGNNIGGIETFYISYYRIINKIFNIDFVYTTPTIVFEKEFKSNNSKLYKLPDPRKHPIRYKKMLSKILNTNMYDTIHINMLSAANIIPIKIAKKCGIKRILLHSHNGGVPKGFLRRILNFLNKSRISNKKEYTYLACSELAGKWLFGNKTNFKIIKNALDVDKYKFDENKRNIVRKKYNINNDDILIGHIGRFSEQKNHKFILQLFKEILKINNKYKLMLIGSGNLEEDIRNYISKYNLKKSVILTGLIDNPFDYYNAFDLFILPSLFEGLPIVGIESQINGVPCIYSSNITEELKIQKNVIFLPIDNVDNWVNYILSNNFSRINDFNLIKYNGYDVKKEAKQLINIYNDLK